MRQHSAGRAERLWDIVVVDDLNDEVLRAACDFLNTHFSSAFGHELTPAYFRWKLGSSNPAGRGFMTVAVHDDRVVGTMTGVRKRLWFDGREVAGCEVGDTFTDPGYRRDCRARTAHNSTDDPTAYVNRSIFGRLIAETTQRVLVAGRDLVYGTPNENSWPGYVNRSGYVELSHQRTSSSHLPLRSFGAEPRILGRRAVVSAHRLVNGVGTALQERRIEATPGPADTLPSDDELDDLWQRSTWVTEPAAAMLRDADYLRHRYADAPHAQYSWHTGYRDERLDYLVVTRQIRRPSGLRTVAIADWIVDRSSRNALSGIISRVIRTAARDVDTVSTWVTNRRVRRTTFGSMGFLLWRRLSVIAYPTDLVGSLVAERTPLDITIGSTDNI